MSIQWTRDLPTRDGWYMWKKQRNSSSFRYRSIQVLIDFSVDLTPLSAIREFWEVEQEVEQPKGGWWYGPIQIPKHNEKLL